MTAWFHVILLDGLGKVMRFHHGHLNLFLPYNPLEFSDDYLFRRANLKEC
jgi:hypothetical protein